MYPGANQDGHLSMTPPIDDSASVAQTNDFLNESVRASSSEDSSSPSPPSPPRRRRDRQKHACTTTGCTMKFDRPSALKQHSLSHTGEKPHPCDVCGRRFSTASNMRRHIPSCPIRRRQSAAHRPARPTPDGHLAPLGGSFTPPREQTQSLESGWSSSSRTTPSHWGSGIPSYSTPRPMYSPTPGVQSSLPSPYPPNDGSAWRQTSIPNAQHQASLQPSRPFMEPSYSPHPPAWPSTLRTPYEPGPSQRPSPSDTISPRDNSLMRWSPGSTIRVARDSQSRFGSTEDFRLSSTPAPVQRYPSDFHGQLHLADPQGSRSQMHSSVTSTSPLAGRLSLNGGTSTTPAEPVQPQAQPATAFDTMVYATRPRNWSHQRTAWSPEQGSSFWSSYSQPSQPGPHTTENRPGTSARERTDEDN